MIYQSEHIRTSEESSTRPILDPQARTALVVDDRGSIRRAVTRFLKAVDPNIVVYHAHHGSDLIIAAQNRQMVVNPQKE